MDIPAESLQRRKRAPGILKKPWTGSPDERLLLRVPEVAWATGYCRSYVYGLIQRGILPVVRLGGSLRVPRAAIDRLIDAALNPEAPVPPPAKTGTRKRAAA